MQNNLEYALGNFDDATSRQEYIEYATGNPYAKVDVEHFKEVAKLVEELWSKRFSSACPDALIIAGLYHDIDRVFPIEHSNDSSIRTTRRTIDTKSLSDAEYGTAELKKRVHPKNCAAIFEDYNQKLNTRLKEDVSYLIERHEIGGNKDATGKSDILLDSLTKEYNLNAAADILCEADALVFFTLIIYSYAKDRSINRIQQKIRFSYNKLSDFGKQIARDLEYRPVQREDGELDISTLIQTTINPI
jgi:hypothetical protein